MIFEKIKLIKEGRLSAEENISRFINKIRKEDGKINAVLHINEGAIEQEKLVDEKIKKRNAG